MNTKKKLHFVCQYLTDKCIRDVPLWFWEPIDINRISLSLCINHTKVKIIRGTLDIQIKINYLGIFNLYDLPNEFTTSQRYQIDTYFYMIKKGQTVLAFLLGEEHEHLK